MVIKNTVGINQFTSDIDDCTVTVTINVTKSTILKWKDQET